MDKSRLIWVGACIAFYAVDAMAYIDPGNGLFAWQGVLAAVGAAMVYFGRSWQAAKRLWTRMTDRNEGS